MHKQSFLLILGLFFVALISGEQAPLDLPMDIEGVSYSDAVPKPEMIIGHPIGTRHTRVHQVVQYFQAIAETSDRVTVIQHASSYEGRPLIHAIVTSPSNHQRLEEIRQNNLKLSDTPKTISSKQIHSMPVIAYLGYSVHGDEASGTEAAILVLYHLAAGNGENLENLLENTVVIIDPMLNPDGRDRFTSWVNGNRGRVATSDLQDREHNQPWPGGRTNHYWFDLNRDWMPVQHPESEGRIRLFHYWRPQLVMDFHEMGREATYFFQPGIPSRNNPNTPKRVFELTEKFAAHHSQALDRIGSLYYTKESFDDFYYGKGSTYADIHGTIGILCEQASSRSLKTETRSGILSYSFSIRNHFIASLGTLDGLAELRQELLEYQREFYLSAKAEAKKNPTKAYLLNLKTNKTRAQMLLNTLMKHRVQIHELRKSVKIKATQHNPGETVIIPMDQPQTRFIKAVMERVTTFQDSLFYDVSSWTLPDAFGVDVAEMRQNPSTLLGSKIESIVLDGGRVVGGQASVAYLMEWGQYFSPRALYRILDAKLHPRLSMEPFEAEIRGETVLFERGTIIIPVQQRDRDSDITETEIHELIQTIAHEDHVTVHAVNSGLSVSGPELGSRAHPILLRPSIALLSGSGTRPYQVGEIWHLLNERMGIPVSLVDARKLTKSDLSQYTTIIMARGSYSELDSTDAKAIKGWVNKGGTLVALENAAKWVIDHKLVEENIREVKKDTLNIPYNQVDKVRGAQQIGGAIFQARLDVTHPVAFGYPKTVALFKNNTLFLKPSVSDGATVGIYTDDPLLSGYISNENLEYLKGSAALLARTVGKGSVILFSDNPNFRAFWYGTNGLFLNAVLFGQAY